MKVLNLSKLLVAATLFSGATIAHAVPLAGVGYSVGQAYVACYLYNAGTVAANIGTRNIINQIGTPYAITSDCGASLPAGRMCYVYTAVVAGSASICHIDVTTNVANVRGQMEVRNAASVTINSIPLR